MQITDFDKTRRSNIAFGGMQGFYYGANCTFFGFLISYLSAQGYSYPMIGITSTIMALTTMIVQPLFGYIIDSFITPKKLMRITIVSSFPFIILFFVLNKNTAVSMVLIAIISIFYLPVGGVIDSWSVRLREIKVEINYPITRSMGSLFYSFIALIMGAAISKVGYLIIPPVYIGMLIILLLISCLADDVQCKNKAVKKSSSGEKRISFPEAFKILISNYEYTIFLISYFFYNLGLRVVPTFLPNIIEERGGTPSHLGLAMFISAFSELPFLLIFSRYVMRIKLPLIYILSLAFGLIRVVTINSFSNIGIIFLAQFFQGMSFGLSIPYLIEYMNKAIQENLKATAITIALAVGTGASLIIGNSLGGVIINNYGTRVFINCASSCLIIAIVIFVIPLFINRRKKQDDE